MVASRQVEISYYRGVGRQRRRGFGALSKVIGRTAIPFLRIYIVPAAKRVGADLLEFPLPEIAEVVSGRKNFKTAAKIVRRQTLRKQLGEVEGSRRAVGSASGRELAYGRQGSRRKGTVGGSEGGSRKRTASRVFLTNSTKQISRSRRNFFTNVSH